MNKRSKYDQRMDALAIEAGKVFEGVPHGDAASVCACLIGYALANGYNTNEERRRALAALIKFIVQIMEDPTSVSPEATLQ